MLFEIVELIEGFAHHKNYLSKDRQIAILAACRRVIKANPLWRPKFVGKGFTSEFALLNTNAGDYGWLGDENGFKYSSVDQNGKPFQPIPDEILEVVKELVPPTFNPENCLINFYQDKVIEGKLRKSHLGVHQDKTEKDLTAPIISISIGQGCVFLLGGINKEDKWTEIELYSGDVVVMAGKSRNAYHGVKHLLPGTCPKELEMKSEARINITIRQVNPVNEVSEFRRNVLSNLMELGDELRDVDPQKRDEFQAKHSPDEIKAIERKFLRGRTRDKHPAKTLTKSERETYADYLESKGNISGAYSFRNYVEPVKGKKK